MSEKIKKLNVTISYSVGYGNLDKIPKDVLNQLKHAYENGNLITSTDFSNVYSDAMEWLVENIKEKDCFDWECEIKNLE